MQKCHPDLQIVAAPLDPEPYSGRETPIKAKTSVLEELVLLLPEGFDSVAANKYVNAKRICYYSPTNFVIPDKSWYYVCVLEKANSNLYKQVKTLSLTENIPIQCLLPKTLSN